MEHAVTPTTEPNVKKTRKRRVERIVLSSSALERVESWIEALAKRKIEVSRAALVSELICRRSPDLSTSEIAELEGVFFDEVKFAKWAVDELKEARKRGESVTLSEILARHPRATEDRIEPIKKPRKKREKATTGASKNTSNQSTQEQENTVFPVKNEGKMV